MLITCCTAAASGSAANCVRISLSLNICASSERICRCKSLAFSGTSSTKIRFTGFPSGASNGIGPRVRTNAPAASRNPLMRPCGIAMPWPNPVDPSRSRANRASRPTWTHVLSRADWRSRHRNRRGRHRYEHTTASIESRRERASQSVTVSMSHMPRCKKRADIH